MRMGLLKTAVVCCGIALTAQGCADPAGPDHVSVETGSGSPVATTSAPVPVLPTSYVYVLTSSCGERGFLGDYRVVVRDEAVVNAVGLNKDYPYRPDLAEVPTLADLLAMAKSAAPGATVDLVVDPEGFPVSLTIDHLPDAIDDEECYEVSELRRSS
jgi:hypothetical protein